MLGATELMLGANDLMLGAKKLMLVATKLMLVVTDQVRSASVKRLSATDKTQALLCPINLSNSNGKCFDMYYEMLRNCVISYTYVITKLRHFAVNIL